MAFKITSSCDLCKYPHLSPTTFVNVLYHPSIHHCLLHTNTIHSTVEDTIFALPSSVKSTELSLSARKSQLPFHPSHCHPLLLNSELKKCNTIHPRKIKQLHSRATILAINPLMEIHNLSLYVCIEYLLILILVWLCAQSSFKDVCSEAP